jgi:magnesium-transporting ATPase (P-type)
LAIFLMVTGDAPATAAIVAHAVGLNSAICPAGPIPDGVGPEKFAVFTVNFSEMWSVLASMLGRIHRGGDRGRTTPALTKGERP